MCHKRRHKITRYTKHWRSGSTRYHKVPQAPPQRYHKEPQAPRQATTMHHMHRPSSKVHRRNGNTRHRTVPPTARQRSAASAATVNHVNPKHRDSSTRTPRKVQQLPPQRCRNGTIGHRKVPQGSISAATAVPPSTTGSTTLAPAPQALPQQCHAVSRGTTTVPQGTTRTTTKHHKMS